MGDSAERRVGVRPTLFNTKRRCDMKAIVLLALIFVVWYTLLLCGGFYG